MKNIWKQVVFVLFFVAVIVGIGLQSSASSADGADRRAAAVTLDRITVSFEQLEDGKDKDTYFDSSVACGYHDPYENRASIVHNFDVEFPRGQSSGTIKYPIFKSISADEFDGCKLVIKLTRVVGSDRWIMHPTIDAYFSDGTHRQLDGGKFDIHSFDYYSSPNFGRL